MSGVSGGGGISGSEGIIVISLGAAGRAADWPPTESMLAKIDYVITLTGSVPQTLTAKHGETIRTAVTPGIWKIDGQAYLEGELYAQASVTADIKPGQNDVMLNMKRSIITVTVSTLAGDGTAGYAEGTGTAAQFYEPSGMAVDASGNVYVADRKNSRIRKISPAGVTSLLAGGTQGYAEGTGAAAQFSAPSGVALGADGTVYVVDSDDQRIRKISPAGVTSLLAGDGTAGYAEGPGTAARFTAPSGVAVDASGNVYVADRMNSRIRKISPTGATSLLAGSGIEGFADGTGAAAQFDRPFGVAVDASGNVYVADRENNRIRKITSTGVVTTLAGDGTQGFADGAGNAAKFYKPTGIAVDSSGNVYVADGYNNRIRKITQTGIVTTLAGDGTEGFADGAGDAAQFTSPNGIAVDASGTVYVADTYNNRIRVIK